MSDDETKRSGPAGTEATLLVVDDTPANLRLLTRLLTRHGYHVQSAANGRLALELARATPPDLVLLDIMMPEMSGYEVCEQLKADERTRDVPVIFVSALDEAVDKVRGFSLGAVDYVTKPFQFGEVLARIQVHLALRSLQKSLQEKNLQLQREIVERQQVEDELRAQKQLFEKLVTVARATIERPTLEATLQNALGAAIQLVGAETGSVFLLDRYGAVTHSILARGAVDAEQRRALLGRVMDEGLPGWVWHRRLPVLIADTLQDKRWVVLPGAPPTRSAMVVPILSGSTVAGILTLTHAQPNQFDDRDMDLIQAAADQMALAVRNAQIFDMQRRLADRQATLYETLRSLSGQLDPDAVLRAAVETISGFVGWPNVAILTPDEAGAHLIVHATTGELSPTPGSAIPASQGIVGQAFMTALTQRVADVRADPSHVVGHPAVRSVLAVPIKRGSQIMGILDLESRQPDAFDTDDVLLAESLVEAIALALDNARLFQATQKERSRLQALIQSSRDGIVFIGLDLYIRVINEPALRLLRLPDQPQDWLDRPLDQALSVLHRQAPALAHALLAEMRRIQKGDEPPGEGESSVPPRTLHWLTLPVMIGDMPTGRLVVLHDVTEERAVERLREDMTRTMVHDLRNPLTSIVASLGMINRGALGQPAPQHSDVLKIAEHSARRMAELVNAILDVSRLESGQMPLKWESFSLAGLVAETFQVQAALAAEKSLRLESDVSPELPPAWADAGLIRRVLQNLVGNAVKFTPAGGAVRVTARVEESQDRSTLLVAVGDTGPGISPDIQSRLFQKFVTGQHEGRGSGLGLAFCKLALEAHGERIWVKSEPGQGTTFLFSLALPPQT